MGVWISIEVKEIGQSIVNNTTNIDVSAICYWDGWSYNHNEIVSGVPSASGYLQIDGVSYDFRNYFNYNRTQTGSEVLFTKNLTVSHDANGKRTVECYALYRSGVSSGNVSASKTVLLTDIPRFAAITAAPNFHDEQNPKIQYANYAGDLVSSLQACISLDGKNAFTPYENVLPGGKEHTFQLSESQREALRKATPNSNTMDVYFLLRTVLGGNTGVATAVAVMFLKDPNPLLSPVVQDTNAKTVGVTGNAAILVAGYSTASVAINATAKKYATIVSRRVEHGQKVLTGDGTLSPVITAPIRIMATDSRGNQTVVEAGNTIVPYFAPSCQIENTMPDGNGTMPLPIKGSWFNGNIGKTANSLTVQYRYKENYGEYGDWIPIAEIDKSENDYSAHVVVEGLNYKSRYTFQARASDVIETDGIISTEKIVKAEPTFDWSKEDFNFNVPVTAPSLEAEKIRVASTPEEKTDATNKKYVDEIAEIIEQKIETKISFSLIWENARPADDFPEQTISVDLKGYTLCAILYDGKISDQNYHMEIAPVGKKTWLNYLWNGRGVREVTINRESVVFGVGLNGEYNGAVYESASACVPVKIYGIKGVE